MEKSGEKCSGPDRSLRLSPEVSREGSHKISSRVSCVFRLVSLVSWIASLVLWPASAMLWPASLVLSPVSQVSSPVSLVLLLVSLDLGPASVVPCSCS